jgi:DNA-binding protein H-NS
MSNLAEMEKQLAELQAKVAEERAKVRAETIDALRAMLASGTLTHDDLRALLPEPQKTGRDRRKTFPPKYRNPETGQTWGGKGPPPAWLRDLSAAERERYLISNANAN